MTNPPVPKSKGCVTCGGPCNDYTCDDARHRRWHGVLCPTCQKAEDDRA
jgi:hypothetical protein